MSLSDLRTRIGDNRLGMKKEIEDTEFRDEDEDINKEVRLRLENEIEDIKFNSVWCLDLIWDDGTFL